MAAEAYPWMPQTAPQPQPLPEGGMADIVNPTPQAPPEIQAAMRPPVDEAEYQQRVGLWQQLQDKLKSDPNLQSALFRFGTALMQPRPYGQTGAGHIGNALNAGANFYQAGVQGQTEQARIAEEQALKRDDLAVRKAESQSRIGLQGSQARHVDTQSRVLDTELGPRVRQIEAMTRGIGMDIDYKGALLAHKQLETDLLGRYGAREAEAKLAQIGADNIYKEALGKLHDAHAKQVQQAVEQGKGWQPTGRKVDEDRGIIFDESLNRTTGEKQRVTTFLPVPYTDALKRAKAEVAAITKEASSSWFGVSKDQIDALSRYVGQSVKDEKEAIQVLARRMSEGHTIVQNIRTDGGVTTKRVDAKGETTGGTAPTNDAARAAAIAAHSRGENVDIRGPAVTPTAPPITLTPAHIAQLRAKGWQPGGDTVMISGQPHTVNESGVATPVPSSAVVGGATMPPTAPATPNASTTPVTMPPTSASAEEIMQRNGVPALLDAIRKRYPQVEEQRGSARGRLTTTLTDPPEIQKLKRLTGEAFLREANRLLGR